MTRTVLAIATALLAATTLAPAAEACVSCEYVPPVVNSGTSKSSEGKSYATKPYQKSRSYTAAEERRARVAKKRVVKSEPVAKDIDTAAGVPSQTSAENENSTISAASAARLQEGRDRHNDAGQDRNGEREFDHLDGGRRPERCQASTG